VVRVILVQHVKTSQSDLSDCGALGDTSHE
jgi:hypothetical protein